MKKTIYCVQPFKRSGARLVPGDARRYTSASEAEGVAELLKGRVAGLVLYAQAVEPDLECWHEPEVMETWGEVPELAA